MHFLKIENFFAKNKFKKILNELRSENDSVLNFSKVLCTYVNKNFEYKKGVTNINSSLDEVWKLKSGVCQDFTNILIQLLRLSKMPSRYVSGYVFSKGGLIGAGATHAWAEEFIPFYGWLGLDPTNNCVISHDKMDQGKTLLPRVVTMGKTSYIKDGTRLKRMLFGSIIPGVFRSPVVTTLFDDLPPGRKHGVVRCVAKLMFGQTEVGGTSRTVIHPC